MGVLVSPIVLAGISLEGFNTVDYNLGDNIIIGGTILYSESIEGRLNIDLVCSENVIPVYFYLVDLRENVPYDFLEGVPARENMLGDCYFWVKLSNDDGLLLETTSEKIHIKDELNINAELDGSIKNPGEVIEINGDVKKINGLNLKEGTLTLILDDIEKYSSRVLYGVFNYKLTLESDIKSGKHELTINAEDGKGNNGKIDIGFEVNAIPTDLKIEMSSTSLKPNDVLTLKILISDQAGDLLNKGVVVDFFNQYNEAEYSVTENSGNLIGFKIPEFASPGVWKLKAVSGNLLRWYTFTVQEVVDKEIKLEGSILTVRNIGNVDYNEDVQIDLNKNGKSYTIIKKTSLKPNQIISIDLTKEIPAGEYNYNVAGSAITGNVVLEHGVMDLSGSKLTGYAALVFVLVFLMFLVFARGKRVALNQREREVAQGRKRLEELRRSSRSRSIVEKGSTKEDIQFLIRKVQEKEEQKDKFSNLPKFD